MAIKRKNNFRVYEAGDLVTLTIDNGDAGYGIVLDMLFGADGMEQYYIVESLHDGQIIRCFYHELAYIS